MRWIQEINLDIPLYVLKDLDMAFKYFFNGERGHPKFKIKTENYSSFRIYHDIQVKFDYIYIPKLGYIKLKEKNYIPQKECCFITVSEDVGRWYISATFEEEIKDPENTGPVIGIDVGIKTLAKTSEDITYENPKVLSKYEKRLKRIHKDISRKKKGSNNQKKSIRKLQKLHNKILNIRKDNLNKITTSLTKTKSVIVIEDLKVQEMLTKQKNVNKSLLDVGIYKFCLQLSYKTKWYGSKLIIAPKYFPSSKLCSGCGNIKHDLKLHERTYHCPKCHLQIDRDLNAAINLSRLADGSSESINAYKKWEVTGTTNIKIIPVPINEVRTETIYLT